MKFLFLLLTTVVLANAMENESTQLTQRMLTETTDKNTLDILSKYRTVTFIGSHNGKSFFVDIIEKNQTEAKASCMEMGLQLAEFDIKSEMDYVSNFLNIPDYCWTGGELVNSILHYKWTHSGALVSPQLSYEVRHQLGFTLSKYDGYGSLATYPANVARCYYCYHT